MTDKHTFAVVSHGGHGPWTSQTAWLPLFARPGGLLTVDRLMQGPRVDLAAGCNVAIEGAREQPFACQSAAAEFSGGFHNEAIRGASRNGHLPVVDRLLQDSQVDPPTFLDEAVRLVTPARCQSVDGRVDSTADDSAVICWTSHGGHLPVVHRLLQVARIDRAVGHKHRHFLPARSVTRRLRIDWYRTLGWILRLLASAPFAQQASVVICVLWICCYSTPA